MATLPTGLFFINLQKKMPCSAFWPWGRMKEAAFSFDSKRSVGDGADDTVAARLQGDVMVAPEQSTFAQAAAAAEQDDEACSVWLG
jgi:hypothetical protein